MANQSDINDYKMAVLGLLEEMNQTLKKVPESMNETLTNLSHYSRALAKIEMKADTIKVKGEDIVDKNIQDKKTQVYQQLQGMLNNLNKQNLELKESLKTVSEQVNQVVPRKFGPG